MDSFFKGDTFKAVVLLLLAIVVIMILNPPRTACEASVESYLSSIKPQAKSYTKALKSCKDHTDLGGCVALFEIIRRLQQAYDDVRLPCRASLTDDPTTKQWIQNSMDILVRAAWGPRPPVNRFYARGWLENNHVMSFCKLKGSLIEIGGEQAWAVFVDKALSELPGAASLGRDETWARSLMSDPCRL